MGVVFGGLGDKWGKCGGMRVIGLGWGVGGYVAGGGLCVSWGTCGRYVGEYMGGTGGTCGEGDRVSGGGGWVVLGGCTLGWVHGGNV